MNERLQECAVYLSKSSSLLQILSFEIGVTGERVRKVIEGQRKDQCSVTAKTLNKGQLVQWVDKSGGRGRVGVPVPKLGPKEGCQTTPVIGDTAEEDLAQTSLRVWSRDRYGGTIFIRNRSFE